MNLSLGCMTLYFICVIHERVLFPVGSCTGWVIVYRRGAMVSSVEYCVLYRLTFGRVTLISVM